MALGRKTGGRRAGTPNKATSVVKGLAQKHGADAIATLVRIMQTHEEKNPQAAVSAAKELLDRGYGKTAQPITGEEDPNNPGIMGPITFVVKARAA